jgi:rubrerythrin
VVLHKTTNGLSDTLIEHLDCTPPTRKYNTVLFSLQLLRNGFYSIETDTHGINRKVHPDKYPLRQYSFCHTGNDLQEAVWNEVCRLPFGFSKNFEIECGIIDAKRLRDQLSVLESRLHTESVSHNDWVSNQFHDLREYQEDTTARLTAQASVSEQLQNQLHDLREYQEDTTARLTAQASVSEQLQNQLDTVRAGMECLHSAVHTLQGEQDTVQETVHSEIESRCEWTAHVMTELTQRKTEVVALREQLERYRKDARWLGYVCGYVCGCVVSLLVVPVAYLITSR